MDGLALPVRKPGTVHARHLYPIWVGGGRRDAMLAGLCETGIEVVVNYRAIHLLSYLAEHLEYRRGDERNHG